MILKINGVPSTTDTSNTMTIGEFIEAVSEKSVELVPCTAVEFMKNMHKLEDQDYEKLMNTPMPEPMMHIIEKFGEILESLI